MYWRCNRTTSNTRLIGNPREASWGVLVYELSELDDGPVAHSVSVGAGIIGDRQWSHLAEGVR